MILNIGGEDMVGRICVREVDTATADEHVLSAARRMNDRKVGTLVVVDPDSRPIGILTDRDLAMRVLAQNCDPLSTTVETVMTAGPRTVREDSSIESALTAMRAGPFRRVPVVDNAGQLVGLLSLDDILDLIAEEFGLVRKLLADESPASLAHAAANETLRQLRSRA